MCTAKAYTEGGYEASQRASDVAPAVEQVLLSAVGKLLGTSTKTSSTRKE
jgi:hypothetical protein